MENVIQKQQFKISNPKWNEKLQQLDIPYFVSSIQHSFQYIIKKHEILTNNPPIRTKLNKIQNKTTFKIKTRYYLHFSTSVISYYLEALQIR